MSYKELDAKEQRSIMAAAEECWSRRMHGLLGAGAEECRAAGAKEQKLEQRYRGTRGTEVPQELKSARSKGARGAKDEWIS